MDVANHDVPATIAQNRVKPPRTGRYPRKVFFLVDSFNIGGTETQAVELARRLDTAQYRVILGHIKSEGPLIEKLRGTAVRLVQFRPHGGVDSPSGLYQILRLAALFRREQVDIVHTHDLWSNLLGIPAAWLARVPAVISSRRDLAHFDWYQSRRRVWLKRIQNLSDVVLTNASPIRDALIREDGFSPGKVRVIHNGIDLDRFRVPRQKMFPELGTGKRIVLVGNMHSDIKGHPWLIAAAPVIVREFPDTRFVFVGDGSQRSQLEQQTENLGLKQNFVFLGRRSDVPDILASCDIAILASKAEGLPNAVLEYLAAGLPTVVTNVGGNVEVIQDEMTGLLVPPQDSQALGNALLRLLRDPALAARLARAGNENVRRNFSFERLIEETDRLYTELLERRGKD
jgi:glycosyltransferase involved in cell wall biosynthesis